MLFKRRCFVFPFFCLLICSCFFIPRLISAQQNNETSAPDEKVSGEKISGEKMPGTDEKVSGEKMSGEKMPGEKVSGEKVSGEEISDEKIQEDTETELKRLLEETDLYEWQKYFDELPALTGKTPEYENIERMIESIALSPGEMKQDRIIGNFKALLFPSFTRSVKRLTGVIAAALLTGFCAIASGDGKQELKNTLMLFICAVSVLALTAVFSDIAAETTDAIKRTERFSAAAEPVLMGLLTALGCRNSVKFLSPAFVFLSGNIIAFIKNAVMPLLLAAGVLTVTNGLTNRLKLGNLVKLLQKTVKWMLGLAAAVYIAFTAVGGISAGTADGISIRTAKYAVDRLVPAVGGMVTGAVDAAISGALLLKNAAGIVSIILLTAITLKPLIELLGTMLALRLTAAVIQPFADERITKMIEGTAENVNLLFASLAAVTSMFVITAVIIISTGSMLVG